MFSFFMQYVHYYYELSYTPMCDKIEYISTYYVSTQTYPLLHQC